MALPVVSYIAENRFGYGAKAGQLSISNPHEYLLNQLKKSAVSPILNTTGNTIATAIKVRQLKKEAKGDPNFDNKDEIKELRKKIQENYVNEMTIRLELIRDTDTPFLERLSWFWGNHFTVSINGKGDLTSLLGPYDRDAIRPHVNGYFFDLLKAVVGHPAMLAYLDNDKSVNPDLPNKNPNNPKKAGRGINENLARELLELHTLGVNGGYTQTDVTNFAHVLTGWTIQKPEDYDGRSSGFEFRDKTHDDTPQRILNKLYAQKGMDQAIAVLNDLAHHPSTARFISTKLARHFVSDNPPQQVIQRMTQAYISSNGYLPAVYKALIESQEVWGTPFTKAKSHIEYVASSIRMYPDFNMPPKNLVGILTQMGQRPWSAASPQGWVDNSSTWLTADSMWKRIEWAGLLSTRTEQKSDARQLAESAFGPLLSENTRQSIARAESGPQATALLLLSPEFQRR